MKQGIAFSLLVLFLGFALGGWHTARADNDEGAPITAPQRVFTEDGITYVKLTSKAQRGIGLKAETLKTSRYRASRLAYGRVIAIGTLLSDYRTLSQAIANAVQAQARLGASHAEYQRLEGLYQAHRNTSKKALQAARAAWQSDRAAAQTAGAQREAVLSDLQARWGARIARWMREKRAPLRSLMAGRTKLVRLTLPLGEVPVNPPGSGQVVLPGGTTAPIKLVAVAPTTEPDLQGQTYYFLASSHIDRLSYGLRVSGRLPYGRERQGVIVPRSAVVWAQGGAWVYVQVGPTRFRRDPVRTGAPVPGGWFQASGVGPGTRIVTRGAQVLFSLQALAGQSQGGGEEEHEDKD